MTYPYIPARKHGGAQSAISRIVIHATVSPCIPGGARNVAAYFQSRNAGGSAHYIVDPGEIVQCVKDGTVAYHAPPNTGTLGVELCDWQKGDPARWDDDNHVAMLKLAAKLVRDLAAEHDVPLVRLSAADLKAGRHGITGHVEVSEAFKQSDHGDPDIAGPFPWAKFMGLVKQENGPEKVSPPTSKPKSKPRALKLADPLMTGDDVREVQKALNKAGAEPKLKVDGRFGAQTRAAVKVYQANHGLVADGVVGAKTRAKLGL